MSRNIKKNYKTLKSKLTKSLSKSKYDVINTSESQQNNSINIHPQFNNHHSINTSTSQNNIKLNTSENNNKPSTITISNLSTINHLNTINNSHNKNIISNNSKVINHKKYKSLPHNNNSKNYSLSKNKKTKNFSFSKNENSRNIYLEKSYKNSISEKPKIHNYNIRTSINSPLSSTSKNEQIIKLKKEIELKNNEINILKIEISEKNKIIKTLNDENINLKNDKSEEEEYEQYSKKIMIRNVKLLTSENQQLRNEIEQYKRKIMTMMKILYNMKNKGIPIDEFVENVENNISSNNSKLNSQKSDITNHSFIPLYIENNDDLNENISVKNQMKIPSLNLEQLNNKYNFEYLSPNDNNKKPNNNNNSNNIINNEKVNEKEMRFGNLKIHFNNDNSCNITQSPISSNFNNMNYNINNKSVNSNSTNVQFEKGNSYSQEILPNNESNNNNKNKIIESNFKNLNNRIINKKNKGNNILLNNKFKMLKMEKKNN